MTKMKPWMILTNGHADTPHKEEAQQERNVSQDQEALNREKDLEQGGGKTIGLH